MKQHASRFVKRLVVEAHGALRRLCLRVSLRLLLRRRSLGCLSRLCLLCLLLRCRSCLRRLRLRLRPGRRLLLSLLLRSSRRPQRHSKRQ